MTANEIKNEYQNHFMSWNNALSNLVRIGFTLNNAVKFLQN